MAQEIEKPSNSDPLREYLAYFSGTQGHLPIPGSTNMNISAGVAEFSMYFGAIQDKTGEDIKAEITEQLKGAPSDVQEKYKNLTDPRTNLGEPENFVKMLQALDIIDPDWEPTLKPVPKSAEPEVQSVVQEQQPAPPTHRAAETEQDAQQPAAITMKEPPPASALEERMAAMRVRIKAQAEEIKAKARATQEEHAQPDEEDNAIDPDSVSTNFDMDDVNRALNNNDPEIPQSASLSSKPSFPIS